MSVVVDWAPGYRSGNAQRVEKIHPSAIGQQFDLGMNPPTPFIPQYNPVVGRNLPTAPVIAKTPNQYDLDLKLKPGLKEETEASDVYPSPPITSEKTNPPQAVFNSPVPVSSSGSPMSIDSPSYARDVVTEQEVRQIKTEIQRGQEELARIDRPPWWLTVGSNTEGLPTVSITNAQTMTQPTLRLRTTQGTTTEPTLRNDASTITPIRPGRSVETMTSPARMEEPVNVRGQPEMVQISGWRHRITLGPQTVVSDNAITNIARGGPVTVSTGSQTQEENARTNNVLGGALTPSVPSLPNVSFEQENRILHRHMFPVPGAQPQNSVEPSNPIPTEASSTVENQVAGSLRPAITPASSSAPPDTSSSRPKRSTRNPKPVHIAGGSGSSPSSGSEYTPSSSRSKKGKGPPRKRSRK